MKFVEEFRVRLDVSNYAFAKMPRKGRSAYISLVWAFDYIALRALLSFREIEKAQLHMRDSDYLNATEEEFKHLEKGGKSKRKKRLAGRG